MAPHEERVVTEKKELDDKLGKLHQFCFTGNAIFGSLSATDRDTLEDQYTAMKQYSDILGRRISAFKE